MVEMTPEARAAKAAYMRDWRRKNADKVKEYDARKWERKAQKLKREKEGAASA